MKKIITPTLLLLFLTVIGLHHGIAQMGQWTWMNGDSVANRLGVYGTQGVFAPGNTPPALYEACEWKDKNGNFWLFGGQDSIDQNRHSDLWEFKPSINQWAWIKGPGVINQTGIYGTQLVPSITNNPGARIYGHLSWVDTAGDLWMFGGYGYDVNGNFNELSDLWRFHIATNEWTWMKGPNTGGNTGTFGTITVEAATNNPPCRCETGTAWIDNSNHLWLFGGVNTSSGAYNDMWRFNIATNNWTWMKGSNTINQPAVYGTLNVPDPANVPGARWSFGRWKDSNGDLYLFGGTNGLQVGPSVYNDLWRYTVSTNTWTWVSGTNIPDDPGTIGTQCVPSVNNVPPSRFENRACWTRPGDNFVLFGGSGTVNTFDDMWNYNVATREWTWTGGTINTTENSVYGTRLVPNPANHPGSRDGSLGWIDSAGSLWCFGGFAANGQMYNEFGSMYNDIWKWTPDSLSVDARFTATPLSGCVPLTVTFHDSTVNGMFFHWDFGDGDTSNVFNPTHTYINPGTYTVKLYATSNTPCSSGEDSLVRTAYITVLPGPTAAFTAVPQVGCVPLTVHFTNGTTNANTYHWDFGDGHTSTATSPTNTYTISGTYTVTLIGYGAPPCNDTITLQITVDTLPVVTSAFNAVPLAGCNPLTVTFNNTSVNGVNSLWSFGDASGSTATSPTHTYTAPGTYSVTLVSSDSNSCGITRDTSTASITVYPVATADFNVSPTRGCIPFTVGLNNTSVNAVGAAWSFGDNTFSTATSPSHTYTTGGNDTITLIAIGDHGCNDTITKIITAVAPLPVVSAFVADTVVGCVPFTVHFTNGSTNGVSYKWYFGDGSTDTAQNPTHTYADTGVFAVSLLVVNDTSICGRIADSANRIAYIAVGSHVNVTSDFSYTPKSGCIPLVVDFTNASLNGNKYYWDFGNGQTDTAKNPHHVFYLDSGTFIVTLVTYNINARCPNPPDTMRFSVTADTCYLYIPNVFTPNGDGKNDYFHLVAEGYEGYHLIIFNRWGMKIFESTDNKYLWNGKINGNGADAPDGTYFYIFNAMDPGGNPFTDHGYLTLIR